MHLQRKIKSIIQIHNDKRSAIRLLKWMMICIGIAIVAVLVLPVIMFLAALIGMIILIRLMDKRRNRNKIAMMNNNNRIADVFDFISPILLTVFRSSSINGNYYYCVNCGTKHKETACPSCGSNFKKTVESSVTCVKIIQAGSSITSM
jgi:hypothetical protein